MINESHVLRFDNMHKQRKSWLEIKINGNYILFAIKNKKQISTEMFIIIFICDLVPR